MDVSPLKQEFLEAMSRAACTISVVTTDGPAGRAGVTVSAMASVSADGPSPAVLTCVHHLSQASAAIIGNGVFCINLLQADQSAVSDVFAGRLPAPGGDKFAGFEWERGLTGAPLLRGALAALECHLAHELRWDSHHVFIGNVAEIRMADTMSPLVYANRQYGKAVPLAG